MKKIWTSSFLLIAGSVMITACKLGTPYARPEMPDHQRFRYATLTGESIANLEWWNLFQDTVLQNMIQTGLKNNRDLNIAITRIREAEAQLGIVRANLLPRINYGGDGTLSITSENGSETSDNGSEITVGGTAFTNVSYLVDLWGRYRNLSEAAFQEYLATEEAYRSLTILIVSSIAQGYLLLRDLDNRLIISERTLETWQQNLEVVQARFNAGMVSEVDVSQSIIQVEEAKTTIQTLIRLRAQTENGLSVLMGLPPQDIERGSRLEEQVFPPDLPADLPSELLDRRPDLRSAERNLEAQTARIGATHALQYPQLTLTADLAASFANPTVLFSNLSAQVFGPLFNAGENKKRLEIEIQRTEQLIFIYENTYLIALSEVENAMIAVNTYKKELEARLSQVDAASNALTMAWVRYENGVTSYLEILDLQRSEFTSYLRASETRQLQLNSLVQLYQALGGGWQIPPDTLGTN